MQPIYHDELVPYRVVNTINASRSDELAQPRGSSNALPFLTDDPPHRPCCPSLQTPLTPCACRDFGRELCDRTDCARLAELVDVGSVEGPCAVKSEGHSLDIDT